MGINPFNLTCEIKIAEDLSCPLPPSPLDLGLGPVDMAAVDLDTYCQATAIGVDLGPMAMLRPFSWFCPVYPPVDDFQALDRCEFPAAEVYKRAAENAYASGDLSSALHWWDRAIEADPTQQDYYLQRGLVHFAADSPQDALFDFSIVHQWEPEAPLPWFMLAQSQLHSRDFAAADTTLEDFLLLFPEVSEARFLRGIALLSMNRGQEALDSIQAAMDFGFEDPQALTFRGLALQQLGRLSEAAKDFAASLDPRALTYLGITLVHMGRYHDSLESLDPAIQIFPEDAELRFYRGMAMANLDRFAEAERDFQAAVEIDPFHDMARKYLEQAQSDPRR